VALFAVFFGLIAFLSSLVVLMVDSVARGHDLATSKRATDGIVKIISEHKNARIFYDLGCARGALALRIKKKFPSIKVCAVDNDPIRIYFARARALVLRRNVDFMAKNIFDVNLKDADVVYTYLWYDVMPPLEKKLQKELKPGAIVITNTSKFTGWKPIKEIVTCPKKTGTPDFETLFVYQKN